MSPHSNPDPRRMAHRVRSLTLGVAGGAAIECRIRRIVMSGPARRDREIWSTSATVVVTAPDLLSVASRLLDLVLLDVECAASRFRGDSEMGIVNRTGGQELTVSSTLKGLVGAALHAARITGGLIDPTVAAAVIGIGYDRDICELTGPNTRQW